MRRSSSWSTLTSQISNKASAVHWLPPWEQISCLYEKGVATEIQKSGRLTCQWLIYLLQWHRLAEVFWPSPRHFARYLRNASSFWHQNCYARAYGSNTTPVWKKFVNPKIAQKHDFVYKSNANCVFSINSHKNSYFYCTCLKLIYLSIIMLLKCLSQISLKKTKTIDQKTEKYIRNSQNNIHKK